MKKTIVSSLKYAIVIVMITAGFSSCKKKEDAKLPTISFKTGGNYTSSDQTVTTSDIINAGVTVDKNEDDLKTFKIYCAVGNGSSSVKKTFSLTSSEAGHYEKDYSFTPQNKGSFETWKFEITDLGGNVNSVSFKLTVK